MNGPECNAKCLALHSGPFILKGQHDLSPISVVLSDDHDAVRQSMKMSLSLQPEIQVVGEARTGREAIEQTRKHHPQVVVLDISMPDIGWIGSLHTHS
ncbi:response regulator transcription factor [Ktedonobacter sp. SOSP1-85]|uniref:response regulator n=1 Tax=Ktedonobacter sp. SOSP1-85 TaxID=2778367 RepID=UPI002105C3D7|nr:response regulator transcription factor [Ktedonobacter sp. SOSP1-85]